MARDGKVPASRFLVKVSVHKVPVNAIWVVIPICAVFTFWAQVEVVIIALCTFAMYVTYGLVVAACLWGKQPQALIDGVPPQRVSRRLCVAALAWIVGILALLCYMTAISMSSHALVLTFWVVAVLSACALALLVTRRFSPKGDLSPAE
jgi:hypothetical protein